ncbi:HAD superfamily hydrolase (TIGR01509 family) [Streptomyces umbrinus]|uniref:HAD superfamily hydrolase (TIGR01509 family) n=1 Tax=Streptomyces umbrinus TaxID=67370 RepID=A0ABU0T6P1_9ACTN|nr:HAD-IA family hydrolase [Streptomyces umbrinus]MDQ1031458.1 HAD superfamily hydrolase (TIGR01509 family) [Streptomyces umbrinus]
MTRPIRGVLVDLDGVVRLWKNRSAATAALACGLPEQAVRRVAYGGVFDLAHHGILTHEEWVAAVRADLIAQFGPEGGRAADLWAADRGEPDPQMVALLRRARSAGLVTGVLTNNTTVVAADLTLHELDGLFGHVANSAALGVTKPSPAAYHQALAFMDLPAQDVAFTDDSATNVAAALHVGLRADHYTSADAFEKFLAGLGVALPAPTDAVLLPTASAGVAPADGHAEADAASPQSVRYVNTSLTAAGLAARLTAHDAALTAVPLGPDAVASITPNGRLTTWRMLPHGADTAAAAGQLSAWTSTTCDVEAEHLPPWLPEVRTAAAPRAEALLHQIGWALHQIAAAAHTGDLLAAVTHLDLARHQLTALASLLARHQQAPWPGATASRYLPPTARIALAASHCVGATTPEGLIESLAPLLALLRQLRHGSQVVLNTNSCWPWQHTTAALTGLLGTSPDLSPRPADDPLYTPALACVYDRHRPLADAMTDALRSFSAEQLAGRDVVELGAGTGRITRHLAAGSPATYRGVEPSAAMAALLTQRRLPGVDVVSADALMLPFAVNSADVVIEHEVLQFTADPLLAADEALRILRPGGRLIRLLLHPTGPDPLTGIDAAYRTAAFADGPLPLFQGKGTDQRVTAHLAGRGLGTDTRTLVVFTRHRTPVEGVEALADRAWPYQHQLADSAHERGMTAARAAAARAAETVPVEYVLRALITSHSPEVR